MRRAIMLFLLFALAVHPLRATTVIYQDAAPHSPPSDLCGDPLPGVISALPSCGIVYVNWGVVTVVNGYLGRCHINVYNPEGNTSPAAAYDFYWYGATVFSDPSYAVPTSCECGKLSTWIKRCANERCVPRDPGDCDESPVFGKFDTAPWSFSAPDVLVDLIGDGSYRLTSWPQAGHDIGVLVHALPGESLGPGMTVNGHAFFGNFTYPLDQQQTTDGFKAIKRFCGSDIVTRLNSCWSKMAWWQDGNRNGIVDAGELESLSARTRAIYTNGFSPGYVDAQGNKAWRVGAFLTVSGPRQLVDWGLAQQ